MDVVLLPNSQTALCGAAFCKQALGLASNRSAHLRCMPGVLCRPMFSSLGNGVCCVVCVQAAVLASIPVVFFTAYRGVVCCTCLCGLLTKLPPLCRGVLHVCRLLCCEHPGGVLHCLPAVWCAAHASAAYSLRFHCCFVVLLHACVQAAVLASIPVVFFTAKGIPGEVEERVDTPAGLVAASMRAMGLGECMHEVAVCYSKSEAKLTHIVDRAYVSAESACMQDAHGVECCREGSRQEACAPCD
jgi:hypothetical protein